MRRVLGRIDEHVRAVGDPAPEQAIEPIRLTPPPTTLDLRAARVTSVIWATGYRRAYPWLLAPVVDERGEIVQRHGATPVPGLYTLGLKFQRRRASHFIGGVGEDAELLARRIVAGDEVGRIAA